MIRLFRLLQNPFVRESVSFDELVSCATDSQQRFIANNPGAVFNTVINGLTVALATVASCASDDIVKLGLRKSAKEAKDTFRRVLPEHLGTIQAKVAGHYGLKALQVKQVFPNGRDIFNTCKDDAVDEHLSAVIAGLTPIVGPMGAVGTAALSEASGLLSNWLALYAASESSTGAKTSTEKEKRKAKENLAAKLHVALMAVATHYIGLASANGKAITDEEAIEFANLYFRMDLLGITPEQEEDVEEQEGQPGNP